MSHICGKIRNQVQLLLSFGRPPAKVFYCKSMAEIMNSETTASVRNIRQQEIITKMIINFTAFLVELQPHRLHILWAGNLHLPAVRGKEIRTLPYLPLPERPIFCTVPLLLLSKSNPLCWASIWV